MDSNEKLDLIISRLDGIDSRFDSIDSRFDSIDSRLDNIDARLDNVDSRIDNIDARLYSMDTRLEDVEITLENEIHRDIIRIAEGHLDLDRNLRKAIRTSAEFEVLSIRVNGLENKVNKLERKRKNKRIKANN